jgi:hypothetical protein
MRECSPSEEFQNLQLPLAPELAVGAAELSWIAEGFRVMRCLPLDGACAAFSHNICPHTGKSPCECRLVVLAVSRKGGSPVTIVAHGHGTETTFNLQRNGHLDDDSLANAVWHALASLALAG